MEKKGSWDYLKAFDKELKPIHPEVLDILEYIDGLSEKNIFKSNVLEIGFGTGHKSIELSKLFDNYYGIEPDSGLYKIFEKLCKKSDCKIKSFNMNLDDFVEKTDLKFDLVILENVIHFINFEDFFRDIKKILNPGGYVLIKNGKAIPYGWGNKEFCKDSEQFNEIKWIKFRDGLKKTFEKLDNSEYLINKKSTNTSNYFVLKI